VSRSRARKSPAEPFSISISEKSYKRCTVPTAAIQQQQNFPTAENNNTKITKFTLTYYSSWV